MRTTYIKKTLEDIIHECINHFINNKHPEKQSATINDKLYDDKLDIKYLNKISNDKKVTAKDDPRNTILKEWFSILMQQGMFCHIWEKLTHYSPKKTKGQNETENNTKLLAPLNKKIHYFHYFNQRISNW